MALNGAEQNRALLERFWTAMRSGDREGLRAVLAPDAVWRPPLYSMRVEGYAAREGVESICDMLIGGGGQSYERETLKIERMLSVADDVHGAIQFTVDGKARSGNDYNNVYVTTFRFEGGVIAEAWEHMDTAIWLQAVRGAA